jgi:hypothetical protein
MDFEAASIGDEEGGATLFDQLPASEAMEGAGDGFAGDADVLGDFFVRKGAEQADATFGWVSLIGPLQEETGEPGGGRPCEAHGAELFAVSLVFQTEQTSDVVQGDGIAIEEVEQALPRNGRDDAGQLRFRRHVVGFAGDCRSQADDFS